MEDIIETSAETHAALTEDEFIFYLNKYGFNIERIEERFEIPDIEDDITDEEIYKLLYSKVPIEFIGNQTLVKLFTKEYKVINIINAIDMYVDYNDMSFKYGLVNLYNLLKGKKEAEEWLIDVLNNFYSNPIKLNNMFYLVKEN